MDVQLWSARIPGIASFAEHHWFLIIASGGIDRWEIWQEKNVGGQSWNHLHKNLLSPFSGVGNGVGSMKMSWSDELAIDMANKIKNSPILYPWNNKYIVWPGPNSNTYVQWILGSSYQLGWRGFGKRYWKMR